MNKKDLERELSKRMNLPVASCHIIIENVLDIISEGLAKDDRVILSNFGIFFPLEQNSRLVRNPQTGQELMMTPRLSVKFRPGKNLKKRMNTPV